MVIFMMVGGRVELFCVVTQRDNTLLITARQIDLSSSSSLLCPDAQTELEFFWIYWWITFLAVFHFSNIQHFSIGLIYSVFFLYKNRANELILLINFSV